MPASPSRPWGDPIPWVGYGPPGAGKTTLFANFPGVAFFYDPQEPGIKTLIERKRVPTPVDLRCIRTVDEMHAIGPTQATKLYNKGVRTAVFDAATGFELICQREHCIKNYNGDLSKEGFFAYGTGPKATARYEWSEWLESLTDLIDGGIDVCIIAHAAVKPYNNPLGPDYDRFAPYLDKDAWQYLHKWAQAVLFCNYVFNVEKEGKKRAKAVDGSQERMISTEWSPAYDAKNQLGLPETIEMGSSGSEAFKNLVIACRQ